MASIPARVSARLVSTLKSFQPILAAARSRDINEPDTSRVVVDLLADLFGYSKYSEITSEHAIRGTYCDLAIKLDGKLELLIEVKAIGIDLKDAHVKQAVDYAANQGADWVVLTNAVTWRIYKVHFTKPIEQELVAVFDLTQLSHRSQDHVEILYLLCREAISKAFLTEYHTQRQALNRFTLASVILSEPVLSTIRRELKRINPGVRIDNSEIHSGLVQDVLKREVIEGEKADEARKKLSRSYSRARKAMAAGSTADQDASVDTDDEVAEAATVDTE